MLHYAASGRRGAHVSQKVLCATWGKFGSSAKKLDQAGTKYEINGLSVTSGFLGGPSRKVLAETTPSSGLTNHSLAPDAGSFVEATKPLVPPYPARRYPLPP